MTLMRLKDELHKIAIYHCLYMLLLMVVGAGLFWLNPAMEHLIASVVFVFLVVGFISVIFLMFQKDFLGSYIYEMNSKKRVMNIRLDHRKEINRLLAGSDDELQGAIKKVTLHLYAVSLGDNCSMSIDISDARCNAADIRAALRDTRARIEMELEERKEEKLRPPLIVWVMRHRISEA